MKTTLKVLVVFAIILGAMCMFSTNKVEAHGNEAYSTAAITKGTPTENSLDNIPNTISLNIKESECVKAPELIMNEVIAQLEKQGMTLNKSEGFGENVPEVKIWFGTKDNDEWEWMLITKFNHSIICLYTSDIILYMTTMCNYGSSFKK